MANFENITIEKGMYQTKGGLTEALEKLDPSENYIGTSLEGLDAFSRQLKRYDIRVSGRGSDCVEKFFQTSNSAALFPEYVSRAVRQGMERADILPNLVATVTDIEGMDYRSIVSAPTNDEKSLKIVGEGAQIPQTTVRTRENLVKLHKRGRMLVASYEALRFQRLDLFSVTLGQIGAYIARAQLGDAIGVLLNGDGNNNAAAVINVDTAGTLTYADLVKLWANMAPYELNTLLAPTAQMQSILALPQMQDAKAGLDFQGTGKMITPMGATLLHAPEMTAGKIIGLDKNCALEMVQAGGVVTDFDKLIDRQLERAAITCGDRVNVANVSERFMALTGKDVSEMCRWRGIIDDACRYVKAHAAVTEPDREQSARLELLAAAYAYRMLEICDTDRITSFTAGDVKFTSSDGKTGRAEQLWEQLCRDNSDIFNTNGFIFGRIVTA